MIQLENHRNPKQGFQMRVLYVTNRFFPDSFTGTQRFTSNLCRGMQKIGHEAKIVCYTLNQQTDFQMRGKVSLHHYRYEEMPVTAFKHHPDLKDSGVLH